MALQSTVLTRKFTYNGMTLADPAPGKDPDQIRIFFANQFPELLTAVVEGPSTKAGVATYNFQRAVGSKG
ncbi:MULTISPECIES: PRTRC system protein C [Acidovorax]|jgi:PRTRC genetic system protein C|uniref:PRTRC system protein C n=1 Tax=Acidovorax facilis TaxID=12917 RepID=A0ABV8DBQ5_9BURK|nr:MULTISPECIES: PRTRC system protein C [Acidovorax]OJV63626.1 MAG: carbamoylphosphate synthase large subunit [Burkholderiales bacterium 64-34]KQB58906.1 carbamoylphosphate synthase large subunit [Acidovorax sp. SD340]MBO1010784.1 PRTRC system protein C [Acidovorax sp. SD340]MCO4244791.1 PRTRC system protein C [Acidovorax facilis]RKR52805.1 PRTRC genetic system protein C [Acidovorax sp. 94]